jgi:segregation and condensation protein B
MNTKENLSVILEAVLFSAGKPMTEQQLLALFLDEEKPTLAEVRQALFALQESYSMRGVELLHVASGYQFQSKIEFATWISRLWEEKPAKYSRALLETLALVAYRQPITRGEIEEIRGVSISTSIFKTLLEDRGWIRVVGHRDVPGRPGLYATTKLFLDYFGLNSLDQLPALPEILALTDLDALDEKALAAAAQPQLELPALEDGEELEESEAELEAEVEESEIEVDQTEIAAESEQ